jgi:predicted amidophosphoribosyltransferase
VTEPDPPVGEPAGFPGCPRCPYLINGPVRVCTSCAARTLEPLAADRCPVCSQAVDPQTRICRNRLCNDPHRRIISIDAVAVFSGDLRSTIHQYKYEGQHGWARIFGRLVLGHLQARWPAKSLDLILANPTYAGPDGRAFRHSELVLDRAFREDVLSQYTFAPYEQPALLNTGQTTKSAASTAAAKEQAAAELYPLLRLPDPDAVRGRRVMIYDDICTTGSQLNTVARYLTDEGGAIAVYGLVLARAPWR